MSEDLMKLMLTFLHFMLSPKIKMKFNTRKLVLCHFGLFFVHLLHDIMVIAQNSPSCRLNFSCSVFHIFVSEQGDDHQ